MTTTSESETLEIPQPAPALPTVDPRRRLRELLAIPDRDRTDAEWDELNEIEIQLAPGNGATPVGNLAKKLPGGAVKKQQHAGGQGKGHGQGHGKGPGQGPGPNRPRPKGPKKKQQQQQA